MKFNIAFIGILLIGLLFRFYQLGVTPNSLNWDEVSWGYNAYSILQTGKDEHGVTFPLSFRAFGDFKQPMYVYLQVPSIAIFGLSAFAVRFPSAILGTLTILSVYFLTYELFRKQKHVSLIAIVAMGFFAVSPWSIQFSRVAFEANVALFFIVTGAALFLRGIATNKQWMTIVGILSFALSGYTYHSAKVFTPLLFAGFLVYAYLIFKIKWQTLLVFLFIFILGNSVWLVDSRTTARGRSVLFTSQQTQILENSVEKIERDQERNDQFGILLHNRRIEYAEKYVQNYLKHFDPNYLFILGDNPRHHPPGMGILYLTLLPFILIGILYLIHKKVYAAFILFYWMLLAPLASSLAVDAPNASRSLVFLPTWDIFAAAGVVVFLYQFNRSRRVIVAGIFGLLFLSNVLYYAQNYFTHTNREYSAYWQYGYKEAVLDARKNNKRTVFLPDVEQAYIFYLFHTVYNPKTYLTEGGSKRIFEKCYHIENAYFGTCPLQADDQVVTTKEKLEGPLSDKKVIKRITHPDNSPAVQIVEY